MNRKVKSIVNAAVAMGYGQLSDYSGNSVSEVLAEFAAKAQEAAKLPAAAAADAGKVPTVQAAGGYALAAIPTELPAATASDEGKVLSVDSSGGYVLAQKSVEDFDIEFECDDGNSEYTVSVTREQVVAAIQAGKKIYFVDNITAERLLATFVDVNQTEQGDAPTLCAYTFDITEGSPTSCRFMTYDLSWEYNGKEETWEKHVSVDTATLFTAN